jgi:hypothetical protein
VCSSKCECTWQNQWVFGGLSVLCHIVHSSRCECTSQNQWVFGGLSCAALCIQVDVSALGKFGFPAFCLQVKSHSKNFYLHSFSWEVIDIFWGQDKQGHHLQFHWSSSSKSPFFSPAFIDAVLVFRTGGACWEWHKNQNHIR